MKRAARTDRPAATPQRTSAARTGKARPPANRPRPKANQPQTRRVERQQAQPRRATRNRAADRGRRQHTAARTRVRVHASGARARVVAFALAQTGKPYIWAADGPRGYDCSGLVKASYRQVGIKVPHQTGQIIGRGRPVSRADLRPGDLVFPAPGHVGIYIGRGRMVHAPQRGDHVRVAPVYAFWRARRLL